MGYIDCDAHVFEDDETWNYFDPKEREFRPITLRNADLKLEQWVVSGSLAFRSDHFYPHDDGHLHELYAPGVASLSDVKERVAHMDRLGVDVQIVFSTFFIRSNIERPLVEAALARSYNRWMAEKYDESGGRIRWALRAPYRMMDRAFEEMEFGKANGAAAIHMHGGLGGMVLDDEYLEPLYAKAQDLDLAISIHVGHDVPGYSLADSRNAFRFVTEVPIGFYRLCVGRLRNQFPRLRWAWLEAGASWIPFVLLEAARANERLMRVKGETQIDRELMEHNNLYVACQIDDDIPYLVQFAGENKLVMGTDYGHNDIGSDLFAGEIIAHRQDLDPAVARKIVDNNGRRLYGIDPSFNPSAASALSAT